MEFISVTKAKQAMDVVIAAKVIALETRFCTEATPVERCKEIYDLYVKFRNLSDCTDDLDSIQIKAWSTLMRACRCYLATWYLKHILYPTDAIIEMNIDISILALDDKELKVLMVGEA